MGGGRLEAVGCRLSTVDCRLSVVDRVPIRFYRVWCKRANSEDEPCIFPYIRIPTPHQTHPFHGIVSRFEPTTCYGVRRKRANSEDEPCKSPYTRRPIPHQTHPLQGKLTPNPCATNFNDSPMAFGPRGRTRIMNPTNSLTLAHPSRTKRTRSTDSARASAGGLASPCSPPRYSTLGRARNLPKN